MSFNGSSGYFETTTHPLAGFSNNATTYTVSSCTTQTSSSLLTNDPLNNGNIYYDYGNTSTVGRLSGTWPGTLGVIGVYAYLTDATLNLMSIYFNGVLNLTKSGASSISDPTTKLRMGATPNLDGVFNGYIFEAFAQNVADSPTVIINESNFLISKWT